MNHYSFTQYFFRKYSELFNSQLNEDEIALLLANCNNTEGFKKIDDKGRHSEYFTLYIKENLVTIVCDYKSQKIITCIKETRIRKTSYAHIE